MQMTTSPPNCRPVAPIGARARSRGERPGIKHMRGKPTTRHDLTAEAGDLAEKTRASGILNNGRELQRHGIRQQHMV